MSWINIINSSLPLLGVLVGGLITFGTQVFYAKHQWKLETNKIKRGYIIDKLNIYSLVLKIDGEIQMQEYIGGPSIAFNTEDYYEKIRPVLYEKFYLLDRDISVIVRDIDNILGLANFLQILEREEEESVINLYNEMIKKLEDNIRNSNEFT